MPFWCFRLICFAGFGCLFGFLIYVLVDVCVVVCVVLVLICCGLGWFGVPVWDFLLLFWRW